MSAECPRLADSVLHMSGHHACQSTASSLDVHFVFQASAIQTGEALDAITCVKEEVSGWT